MNVNYFWFMVAAVSVLAEVKVVTSRLDEMKGALFSSNIEYMVTDGEIVKSEIKSGYKYIDNYDILYMYRVKGDLYISDVINFLGDYSNTKKYLNEYPVGKKVQVYYNSESPDFSVLEPSKKGYAHFYLPLFLLGIFFYSIFMTVSLKSKKG